MRIKSTMSRLRAVILLALFCIAAYAQNIFTDQRDGKKYKTVKIGEQIWMAENLNYDASAAICYAETICTVPVDVSKCYDNDESNCAKYGRLYDWETANKACPAGWHLPSKSEYEALDNAVGGENVAGKKLKAKDGWNEGGNGTDDYGFSALPGGLGNSSGNFKYLGSHGDWWSASEGNASYANGRYMNYKSYVHWLNYDKRYLRSVRCVRD